MIPKFVRESRLLRRIARKIFNRYLDNCYEQRLEQGKVERPHYGYCVYQAAILAKKLNYPRISIIEFGVAGGRGLVNLEHHVKEVEKLTGIEIEIYGFDTGEGLLKPVDYRDLPYHWKEGFYKMDYAKLEARIERSQLVLGDVRQTTQSFFESYNPAPIGAMFHDLDLYSSTAAALKMLEVKPEHYLPRIFCYFDDTTRGELALYNDYTGERLAINEFNQNHEDVKLGLPYHLLSRENRREWYHQIWIGHFFSHSRYNHFIGESNQQLPLD